MVCKNCIILESKIEVLQRDVAMLLAFIEVNGMTDRLSMVYEVQNDVRLKNFDR
jgi:hypothetical protein